MTTLLLPLLFTLQISSVGPLCDQLGNLDPNSERSTLATPSLSGVAYDQKVVVVKGFLREGFQDDYLCRSKEAAIRLSLEDCFRLFYDWETLGAKEAKVRRVLRQWKGAQLKLSGHFRGNNVSSGRFVENGRAGQLEDISWVRNIDQGPRESYCLEYSGPGTPSRWEQELPPFAEGEMRCLMETERMLLSPLRPLCVDPVKQVVWIPYSEQGESGSPRVARHRSEPFVLPSPYATRDLQNFAVLKEDLFLFTLPDRHLYLWDGVRSRELVGGEVDQVRGDGEGAALYRATELGSEGKLSWNALVWINSKLETDVLWESDRDRLERFFWRKSGRRLEIVVRDGDSLRLYHPSAGGWTPAPEQRFPAAFRTSSRKTARSPLYCPVRMQQEIFRTSPF